MWFLILAGVVSLLSGILFLFSPKTLDVLNNKVSTKINKWSISIDEKIWKLRIGVGVSLLLTAFLFFFVAYFLAKKYGSII
jgi:Na+-driven multidrug efflux pump